MDWIHCNNCFNQPSRNNTNFVLTSCGHIFCVQCEDRNGIDQCKVCKNACNVTTLSANMKPEVGMYFEDLEDFSKKLNAVICFQKQHRFRLAKAHLKMKEKYKEAKVHIRKMEAYIQKLRDEMESLKRSKRNAKPSPRSYAFNFTPNISEQASPAFNSASSQKTIHRSAQNSAFRIPDARSYHHYRNLTQRTPSTGSPAKITPKNFSAKGDPLLRSRLTSTKFPKTTLTPPYNDFHRMRMKS